MRCQVSEEVFRITWEAQDGYVGGSRPHTTKLKLEHFDGSESVDEIREQILNEIQTDFESKVTPGYSDSDVDVLASQIHAALQKEREKG
jgi:hypothetical protein